MNFIKIIEKKKHAQKLTRSELEYFINGVTDESIPDYQISAFLMAMCFNPPDFEETYDLTDLMAHSGNTIDLSSINGIKADKHSTGGVGDKTTLIIAPMVAAAEMGVSVPKMSGRGLGHTGGTVDKLESVPNINTAPDKSLFIETVNKTGLCVIGQTENLAPADKKLYALRDVTATIDCIPLIAASVMSKKLAFGSDVIVLDVKCGDGAFIKNLSDANLLAETMVKIGSRAGKKIHAFITDMSSPLGFAIGNSLELKEVINILKGNQKGTLYSLCVSLAAEMIYASTGKNFEDCKNSVIETINNGKALAKLADMVKCLGGDESCILMPEKLVVSPISFDVASTKTGYIQKISAYEIGCCALSLGTGRVTKQDKIDHGAGIILNIEKGDYVQKGQKIATFYCKDKSMLDDAARYFENSLIISAEKPKINDIIIKKIR